MDEVTKISDQHKPGNYRLVANIGHSLRVHYFIFIRGIALLLIYFSIAICLTALPTTPSTALLLICMAFTGLVGFAGWIYKLALSPCRCGIVSISDEGRSQKFHFQLRRAVKKPKMWLITSLFSLELVLFASMVLTARPELAAAAAFLRVCGGLSIMLVGVALLAVTNTKWFRSRLYNSIELSESGFKSQTLESKTNEELQDLITVALENGRFDQADTISTHLLAKVEKLGPS